MWSNLGTDIWNATAFYRQIASEGTHTTLQVVSTAANLFGPIGFIIGRLADLANAGSITRKAAICRPASRRSPRFH